MDSQNYIQKNKTQSIQQNKHHRKHYNSNSQPNNQNNCNLRKKISHFSYHLQLDLISKSQYYFIYKGINETNLSKVQIKVFQMPKKLNPQSQNYQQNKNIKTKQFFMLQNQITTSKKLQHINILKFVMNCSTQNSIYIIYQYFSNIKLPRYIEQLKNQKIITSFNSLQKIVKDTYQTLKYIVNQERLFPCFSKHCILVKQQNQNTSQKNISIKITGVGNSLRTSQNQSFNSQINLNKYLLPQLDYFITSPQTLRNKKFTIQSQAWTFGILLFQSFIGRLPWKKIIYENSEHQQKINVNQPNEQEEKIILSSIIQCNIQKEIEKKVNSLIQQIVEFKNNQIDQNFIKSLGDLIVCCLTINPQSRISFSEIEKHLFFTKQQSLSKKLEKFHSSIKTQINYLYYLSNLNSLINQFLKQKNQIALYSRSLQNKKINCQILFNFQICLVKQILIQMYTLEKTFSRNQNLLNFNDKLWKAAQEQREFSVNSKKIWKDFNKKIIKFKRQFIESQKWQEKYKKWILSPRINNFKKLVTVTNSNFEIKSSTQCDIASNYYLLKFIKQIIKDLYFGDILIKDFSSHHQFRQKINNNQYFCSILLLDYLISHYQIQCLKLDDIQPEKFNQQSCLQQILQYFTTGQQLLTFMQSQKNETSRKAMSLQYDNKKYQMLSILKQLPIIDRAQCLKQKIKKLQIFEQKINNEQIQEQ